MFSRRDGLRRSLRFASSPGTDFDVEAPFAMWSSGACSRLFVDVDGRLVTGQAGKRFECMAHCAPIPESIDLCLDVDFTVDDAHLDGSSAISDRDLRLRLQAPFQSCVSRWI
jgi:hypothetical protein